MKRCDLHETGNKPFDHRIPIGSFCGTILEYCDLTMHTTRALVEEWLSLDQNEATRAEIQSLWHNQNIEELDRRLGSRIEFGTAGSHEHS